MKMAELVRLAQIDPIVRETLTRLFRFRHPVSVLAACSMFARWIRANTVLINEPVEILTDPVSQLEDIQKGFKVLGDCDDVAMLAASLLAGAGLDVRFVAALAPDLSGNGHVWTEAWDATSARWQRCDPTTSRTPPTGWMQLEEEV